MLKIDRMHWIVTAHWEGVSHFSHQFLVSNTRRRAHYQKEQCYESHTVNSQKYQLFPSSIGHCLLIQGLERLLPITHLERVVERNCSEGRIAEGQVAEESRIYSQEGSKTWKPWYNANMIASWLLIQEEGSFIEHETPFYSGTDRKCSWKQRSSGSWAYSPNLSAWSV